MFRQRSGSSLCYSCGKLNRVDATTCFYCGARWPGLWGFGPLASRLIGRVDFAKSVMVACAVVYVVSLLLDPAAAMQARSPFDLLAPSGLVVKRLGAAGALPWSAGWWWTLITGMYLHGSLLHILFNMLWVRQLAPPVEQLFGTARLIVLYSVAGVVGFAVSNTLGVAWTLGASGAVFGLLGAMVAYGRTRGGTFGVAVFRQYGQWALLIFLASFFLQGVNNWAHAGGFAGGYLAAVVLGPIERRPERGLDRVAAMATVGLTTLAFALAIWNGFLR